MYLCLLLQTFGTIIAFISLKWIGYITLDCFKQTFMFSIVFSKQSFQLELNLTNLVDLISTNLKFVIGMPCQVIISIKNWNTNSF